MSLRIVKEDEVRGIMINGKFVTREDFLKDFNSDDCTVSEKTFKTKEEFEMETQNKSKLIQDFIQDTFEGEVSEEEMKKISMITNSKVVKGLSVQAKNQLLYRLLRIISLDVAEEGLQLVEEKDYILEHDVENDTNIALCYYNNFLGYNKHNEDTMEAFTTSYFNKMSEFYGEEYF